MAERPILFNTEMVRAILEGRKKATRRIVKAKGYNITGIPSWAMFRRNPDDFFFDVCTTGNEPSAKTATTILIESPARPGDVLYVRETWCALPVSPGGHIRIPDRYYYRADPELRPEAWRGKWRPSIHMPKEAARLFLRVTDVRCERLQECGKGWCTDIEAEGVQTPQKPILYINDDAYHNALREEMQKLWDSTIKPVDIQRYGWAANPWVWVIEFERCEKP